MAFGGAKIAFLLTKSSSAPSGVFHEVTCAPCLYTTAVWPCRACGQAGAPEAQLSWGGP